MKKLIAFGLLAGLLVGCANKPIYNVQDHPIPVAAQQLPLDRIEAVIVKAGQSRHWKFEHAGEGHLIATQVEPKHSATVDIYFNQRNFRIIHQATTGLKEKDGTVHRTYNRWIHNLETDIETYLANATLISGGNA